MKPRRRIGRRSFLRQVTGGAAAVGSLGLLAGRAGAGQETDSDRYISDQPNQGRGQTSQITDKDPGDAVGNGSGDTRRAGTGTAPERAPSSPFQDNQNRQAPSGVTDSDPSDPAGNGRATPQGPPARSPYDDNQQSRHAPSGFTDTDPTDPSGDGRTRSCTDQDSGQGADPARRGRRC